MSIFLNVLMLSQLYSFDRNRTVVPGIVVFKAKGKYFALRYSDYAYKNEPIKSIARLAYHQSRFTITNAVNVYDRSENLSDKWLLNAFRFRRVKVYAVILIDALTGQRIGNISDFEFRYKVGYDIEVEFGKKTFKAIKLHKNFQFF